jgi:hypothetical protein
MHGTIRITKRYGESAEIYLDNCSTRAMSMRP